MGILLRMGRPVAVWGASGPPRAVRAALRRPVAVWGASGPPRAVRAALRRPVAVWGASGPPRAVRAALRRPVAVWGIWAPRAVRPLSGVLWRSGGIWAPEASCQGRSPASCGGLGGIWAPEGRQGRSPASCGGLGGIWIPRLEFSGQLSRKVAQGFDRGRIFEHSRRRRKHGSAHLYKPCAFVWIRQHTRGHDKGCALP